MASKTTDLLRNYRILVADDELELADLITSFLRARGATVLQVSTGNDAFAAIQKDAFDVLITDLRMPDGTGIELIRRIRRSKEDLSRVPRIIVNTGFIDQQGKPYLMALGAEAVLEKPYSFDKLLSILLEEKPPL